jgi:uncharacterized protein (TIGR00296 family)
MISPEEGQKLLLLAKQAILAAIEDKKVVIASYYSDRFAENCGCFVTIHKNGKLRGCIGLPEQTMPLYKAIVQAAKGAAKEDPRFKPLQKQELKDIKVEISVLTKPELLEVKKPGDYLKKIRIGKDGLIIRSYFGSGLLLPQVAAEYKWDAQDLLEHTCLKAGLARNSWEDLSNRIYTFQAEIFSD